MHQRHWIELTQDQHQELIRWRTLGEAIIENEPGDMAADGVTCLMVWRKAAAADLLKS